MSSRSGRRAALSVASNALSVSQPALSVAIAHVESCVGEILFLRRKGVAITPTVFGRLFLKDAEALLAQAQQLERPGALSRRTQERATLGVLAELAPRWLAPVIALLRTSFPETEVRTLSLSFETLAEALFSGQVDIGLTYDLGLDATFQRDLITRVAPCIWVAPEDKLAGYPAVSLADIVERPLILSDQDLSIQHMLGLFRRIGAIPRVSHRASSIELLLSLAANGEGTGLSYTNPAGRLSYDGRPVEGVPIRDPFAMEPIVLSYIGSQPVPLPQIRASIQALARDIGRHIDNLTE